MIKKINKTSEINKRLEEEGKITHFNTPTDRAAVKKMNERLEVMRRDFRIKEKKSLVSSTKITLM